ncbi:MAG: hypothetical protein K8R73_00565 [Clostridiales bacterium]|nr:hypothetical protein [Clostridiales bacterium]
MNKLEVAFNELKLEVDSEIRTLKESIKNKDNLIENLSSELNQAYEKIKNLENVIIINSQNTSKHPGQSNTISETFFEQYFEAENMKLEYISSVDWHNKTVDEIIEIIQFCLINYDISLAGDVIILSCKTVIESSNGDNLTGYYNGILKLLKFQDVDEFELILAVYNTLLDKKIDDIDTRFIEESSKIIINNILEYMCAIEDLMTCLRIFTYQHNFDAYSIVRDSVIKHFNSDQKKTNKVILELICLDTIFDYSFKPILNLSKEYQLIYNQLNKIQYLNDDFLKTEYQIRENTFTKVYEIIKSAVSQPNLASEIVNVWNDLEIKIIDLADDLISKKDSHLPVETASHELLLTQLKRKKDSNPPIVSMVGFTDGFSCLVHGNEFQIRKCKLEYGPQISDGKTSKYKFKEVDLLYCPTCRINYINKCIKSEIPGEVTIFQYKELNDKKENEAFEEFWERLSKEKKSIVITDNWNTESDLIKMGYSTKIDLKKRRQILIEKAIPVLGYRQVVKHIEWQIKLRKNSNKDYSRAIDTWKADLRFLNSIYR